MSPDLSLFSACEISDALVKLGQVNGGLVTDIRSFSPATPTKICGQAYTVKMVFTSDTQSPKLSAHFVDTAPEGAVIVIDAPTEAKNAVWGGLMSAGAQAKGALGVIISGRCRDIAEHRALQFPVFARGQSTVGQSPHTRPSAVNIPVTMGTSEILPSVTIHPGDLIVADEDGVVCVPQGMVEQVVSAATKGREIDERCMADIKAGMGIQASFKKHRG